MTTHRHADLHDPHERRLVERVENQTLYPYGSLFEADTLCYWSRELAQAGAILQLTTDLQPDCLF